MRSPFAWGSTECLFLWHRGSWWGSREKERQSHHSSMEMRPSIVMSSELKIRLKGFRRKRQSEYRTRLFHVRFRNSDRWESKGNEDADFSFWNPWSESIRKNYRNGRWTGWGIALSFLPQGKSARSDWGIHRYLHRIERRSTQSPGGREWSDLRGEYWIVRGRGWTGAIK